MNKRNYFKRFTFNKKLNIALVLEVNLLINILTKF